MVKPFLGGVDKCLTGTYPLPYTLSRLLVIENHMAEKLVRMVSWVSKAQKAKVKKLAKRKKGSESAFIRGLIDNAK